ncbi:helix-turn-helix transcriptional regulator [Achromobacter sp.]|uniref:helix-turn-helix domain-containing protein n=1 Tax=Achromobacter sp. TaxID=134375 RepID=UPI0028AE357E|nr:helix-turn-helix transcriptional regulator [Achromobacter sp.]
MKEIGPNVLHVDGVPVFVVLRYDEYQRLLKLASASQARPPSIAESPHASQASVAEDSLTTPSTDPTELPFVEETGRPRIPIGGLIPHEVIVAAVHNHWSLARAWREYLGLNQLALAQRLDVSVSSYLTMEAEFSRLPPTSRERLADGLGIGVEQLNSRPRRLRRTEYK